jgi:hypothetical protein
MTAFPMVADSATMLRRNLRRMRRYPSLTFFIAGLPVVFLLLFVYVFGGAIGAGLGDVTAGREAYLAYVIPGILLMTVAGGAQGTAISVAMDMTEGIIARFRTMAIARGAVLTGHVIGSVIQTMLAVVIVMAVALLIGFRPTTGPLEWAQGRRDCEQPADVPGDPAVPEQRLRADGDDARPARVVRRAPAVHADHRDRPGAAARDADRQQRDRRRRVVPRGLRPGIRVGDAAVQPEPRVARTHGRRVSSPDARL